MNRNTQNQTRLTTRSFAASLDSLYEMLTYVRECASEIRLDRSSIGKVELAAEEALVNVIRYSYPKSPGAVDIHCGPPPSGSGFQMIIQDWGIPYNPLTSAKKFDPNDTIEEPTVGGYGIFFILQMMDEVHYKRDKDKNILTLIKYS